MIPKKIHYCWFGKNPLPADVKKCIESWKKCCPDYEIIEWNESNFDITQNPFMKAAYENKAWAFVSDYARLKVVYDNGGIYLDTDVELLKSLDSLLDNPCYLAIQQRGRLVNTGLGFGAEKGSVMIQKMLEEYENNAFSLEKRDALACPNLNSKSVRELCGEYALDEITSFEDVKVFPPQYFDPYAPGDAKNLLNDDTYSIHHYSASWTSNKQKFKRKIVRLIGQDRIYKIKQRMHK